MKGIEDYVREVVGKVGDVKPAARAASAIPAAYTPDSTTAYARGSAQSRDREGAVSSNGTKSRG